MQVEDNRHNCIAECIWKAKRIVYVNASGKVTNWIIQMKASGIHCSKNADGRVVDRMVVCLQKEG